MCRNLSRASVCGLVGLGVGFGGGLIAIFAARVRPFDHGQVAVQFMAPIDPATGCPPGLPLVILMMGARCRWAIAAIPAGLGQGIALREKKVIFNGIVGAVS